jgi:hypothetical protein
VVRVGRKPRAEADCAAAKRELAGDAIAEVRVVKKRMEKDHYRVGYLRRRVQPWPACDGEW